MKKLLVGYALFAAFAIFGTNGGVLTGISPTSQGMGGTGAGMWMNGADAMYKNPSLLAGVPGKDGDAALEIYTTIFKQNAMASSGNGTLSNGEKSSTAGAMPMPTLGATYKVNDKLAFGLLASAYGGASADFENEATVSRVVADALYSRVGIGGAYQVTPEISVGIAPYLSYSHLKLHALTAGGPNAHGATAFGATFGASAKIAKDLTFGASYTMKTKYTYKQVIDLEALGGAPDGNLNDIESGDPALLTAGFGYHHGNWRFALDYLLYFWANSEGQGQGSLGWNNQSVFAAGAEYTMQDWQFRFGFNYGKSPIDSVTGELATNTVTIGGAPVSLQTISLMNMAGFPGINEAHLSAGVGYGVTSDLHADLSFVYAFSKTVTRAGLGVDPTVGTPVAYLYTATVSQWALALGAEYRF